MPARWVASLSRVACACSGVRFAIIVYACITRFIASCIAIPWGCRNLTPDRMFRSRSRNVQWEGSHGPGDTLFAVRKTDGPWAQLQRAHRVEMRVLRPAGPDGDGRAAEMGRWPACYSYFRASPLNALRPHQQVDPCRFRL